MNDDIDALYLAVQQYVENRSGKVVAVGGIQVIEWPGDGEHRFTVGIKVTGRKPSFDDTNPSHKKIGR